MKDRNGCGLAEATLAVALGSLVLLAAFDALIWSRRAEARIGLQADLAGQVALARSWLARDLERLDARRDAVPLEVRSGSDGAQDLTLRVDTGSGRARVTYQFDPRSGSLSRQAAGEPDRSFRLGCDAAVVFVKVDPSFAGGGAAEPGRYNNRLVYRITAAARHLARVQSVTLVGSSPFVVKASRDTFPYWNPGTQLGSDGVARRAEGFAE